MAWTSSTDPRGCVGLADAVERISAAGLNHWDTLDKLDRIKLMRTAACVHIALLVGVAPADAAGLALALTGLLVASLAWLPGHRHVAVGYSGGDTLRLDDAATGVSGPAASVDDTAIKWPEPGAPARTATPASAATWADLSARISHDLRTPLNAIIGFSEMMDAEILGPVGNDRYREYLAHIRDSGVQLLKSTEDTLALIEMMGHGETAPRGRGVDLGAIVREVAPLGADLARLEDAEVVGERRVLRQIVVNLVGAARQRAGSKGQMAISTRCEGSRVVLAVRVTGEPPLGHPEAGRLPICLARTLLEMQGAQLIEGTNTGETDELTGWQAVTVLDRTVQRDFFERG